MSTPYIYEVRVKTDAAETIPDAIKNLVVAQDNARTAFDLVTEFVKGDKFAESIVGTIGKRLDEMEKEKIEVEFGELLDPMMIALEEIQTALLMLLDVESGELKEFLERFDKINELTSEHGLRGFIQEGLNQLIEQTKRDKDGLIKVITDLYGSIDPTIGDVSGNFIENDEFTERFKTRPIGDIDDIFKELKPIIIKTLIADFQDMMKTHGENDYPTPEKIFENVAEGGDKFKKLQTLITSRNTLSYIKENMESNPQRGLRQNKRLMKKLDAEMAELNKAIDNNRIWNAAGKEFSERLKQRIEVFGTDLLKEETSLPFIIELVKEIFQKVKEVVKEKLQEDVDLGEGIPPAMINRPNVGKAFMREGRQEGLGDKLDKLKIDDPFGINTAMEVITDVMAKARARDTENLAPTDTMEKFLTNEFMNADVKGLAAPLAGFLKNRLGVDDKDLLKELEVMFKAAIEGNDIEQFHRNLEDSLAKINMEKFGLDPNTDVNIPIAEPIGEVNFEEKFERAVTNRDEFYTLLNRDIMHIINEMNKNHTTVNSRVGQAINLIKNIPVPKPRPPATSTNFIGAAGG